MIKIGSWNLCNFSKKREMSEIGSIVKQFDILAIQEVRDELCIQMLCDEIFKNHGLVYKFILSDPICSTKTSACQTGKRKERYAVLYKDITLVSYDLIKGDEHFVRPPLVAFFKCKKFDFVLATIHVVWGKKSDRNIEIRNLNTLLEAIKKRGNGEKDIILCGDFNTPPSGFNLPDYWRPLINEQTMVNSKNKYDNIWISNDTKEYNGIAGVLKGAHKLSDHFPIYATFDDEDDDEGIPDLKDINL